MKQTASMRKLAALQPEIRALQQRYSKYKKTDPRRLEMNREISELYRRNNASPLGGCLPNLLQVPFLWAINSLLSNSIDFRKAPFVGWIRDLSLKDPLYILPVLMGVSTLISQMTAPLSPGADPTQTRIMMFVLPLLLTYVFLNLASGLNLYFLCSNFFQIAFQKIEQQRYTRA